MNVSAQTEIHQAVPAEFLSARDGVQIPVRIYGRDNASTPVVLSHGLQSHSGWFAQSCSFLADNGFSVYAYDRRGSGLSEEARGDCNDFQTFISDLETVARSAMKAHGASRVHVFGHSLGAVISSAFAAVHSDLVRSLILATPGFYSQNDIALPDKLRVLGAQISRRPRRLPALLKPEVFSEMDDWIAWIRSDELAQKGLTSSLLWQIVAMRKFVSKHQSKLRAPVLMLCAAHDPICDTPRNHRFWSTLPSDCKQYIEYERTRHVIEFGPQRKEFFADLLRWLERMKNTSDNNSTNNY